MLLALFWSSWGEIGVRRHDLVVDVLQTSPSAVIFDIIDVRSVAYLDSPVEINLRSIRRYAARPLHWTLADIFRNLQGS